jgi:pyruvate dehydrogenase E1 component beta subunit
LAAVITESEAFNYMDAPILRICGADVPIPYNPKLEASIVPTTPVILDGIKKVME